MNAVDPTTVPTSVLRDALVAGARGVYREEAGVQFLIDDEVWLGREDFLRRCVRVDDAGWASDETVPLAGIDYLAGVDWDAAATFAESVPASGGERAVLELAAALAGGALGDLVARLDPMTVWLFLDAVAHVAGWHERGITRVVGGGVR